jgi:uncharacterized delta-60 repeat protein
VLGRQVALVDLAKLRSGEIVVAGESTLYAYRPNGKPDRHFGDNGVVTPYAPASRRVTIESIAVDDQNRIVLVGGAGHAAGAADGGDATSYAAIERYLPNGRPDPDFGNTGAVITDFAFPPPARPAGIPDYSQISLPVDVQAGGVAVDSRGRIVVTGTRAATYVRSRTGTFFSVPEPFAARFTARGDQDSTFADAGTLALPGLSWIAKPALDQHDGIYLVGSQAPESEMEGPLSTVVGRLTPSGTSDPKFGNNGWKSLDDPFNSESRLTPILDRAGRLLLVAEASIERLEPNGSLDHTFGHKGVATVKSPNGEVRLNGLAAGSGRILAVGTLGSQTSPKAETTYRLLLVGLTDDGHLDKRFGQAGMVTTGFGRKAAPVGQTLLLDGARALAGGTASYGPRRPSHLVLARYLLGR